MSAPVLDFETTTVAEFFANGNGRTVLLTDVSWAEYENFLQQFLDKNSLSLAYNNETLEIMTKSLTHEDFSRAIYNFVLAYCEHFDLNLESSGSTTFKRARFQKGVEPDECFYVNSAEKVINLGKIDWEEYPVPDVAVEIDLSTESLDKFPIYAALQVSELWIYNGLEIKFFQLAGEKYNQTEASFAFPFLSAEVLTEFLNVNKTEGQTAALKQFRQWLQRQQS